jgi:hypothetical protein
LATGTAAGGGSASAQLIGTDAVRGIANFADAQGQATGQAAVQQGRSAAQGLTGAAGGLSGGAQGSGSALGSATSNTLAPTGSVAAQGQGAFGAEQGTQAPQQ